MTPHQKPFWNDSCAIPMERDMVFTKKNNKAKSQSQVFYQAPLTETITLPIFYFSFYQKTNLNVYKRARLLLSLFTFF